jgi:hypothetical protein
MRAQDLTGEAKELYEEWRSLGYTERQALDRVQRSGVVRESELYNTFRDVFGLSREAASTAALGRDPKPSADPRERTVAAFQALGLSEGAAEIAADGRDGPSRRASGTPVSEAEAANLRPDPAYIGHVVRKIEEVASDLCRRGVPEEKALRESAFELMRVMPNDQLADWVARIAAFRWPQLYPSSGSSSGGTVSESPARKPGSSGRRSRTVHE